jgi:hypothetical protein
MPNEGMNIPHAKARGEWAELRFMTRATELGFRVTKPWGDSSPYDLATTPKRSRKQSEGSREAAQECSPRRKPWVSTAHDSQAPVGRKKLIPDVPLVVCDVVPLEECDVFVLKRVFPMMCLLRGNVFCDRRDTRFAHTEHSVSGLPRKF